MEQAMAALIVITMVLGNTQSSPAPSLSSSSSSLLSPLSSLSSSPLEFSPLSYSRHTRSAGRLTRRRVCSRNTPCMWAYCPWSPRVLLDNDDCKYIDSICVCQWGQTCSRTNDVRPDNDYLTVPFVCKWVSREYAELQ